MIRTNEKQVWLAGEHLVAEKVIRRCSKSWIGTMRVDCLLLARAFRPRHMHVELLLAAPPAT